MKVKAMKRFLSAFLALFMLATLMPVSMPQTVYALSDEDISATVELGKGFNLLAGKTFEAGNLQSAPIFKSMENMNPTKNRLGDVESKMTYITSMSSYLDNTHTDISVDVGVSTEILLAKTDIKAKFGFKGTWESEGSTNKSRLILEILAKAYKYSMNINQGDPWAKDENGNYVTLNDKFANDLMNMDPKAFFNTYGTHIVTQYDAGGEAYTSYEGTDTSNSMKSEFDIEANASVDVSTKAIAAVNVAVNTSGGEKHENSFANNNQQMSMRVRGGDPMYSTFDAIISGDADDTVNGWLASMYGMDENTGSTKSTMIKSDNMQLFAMWDLLAMDKSQSHTARIEELKKYYMDNVKEEIVDMYQEFIYGIPTNFADEYAQINAEIVTDKELGSVDAIPEGFLPVRTEDDIMRMNGNQNYILMDDIKISDDFIHAAVEYDEFNGVFDGNGHTISGLKLIDTKEKYIGLFPLINEGAVIKNLTIKDAEVVVESKEGQTVYAGILCGANTDGLTGSNLGKIMDVRIEDSSITIKGGAGTTYLGGIVGYTDSRNDTINDRAVQRATVKNCRIINEREGANSSVGAVTGYHKGQGGFAVLRVASYYNEVSSEDGYVGGVIGRSASQAGSYVFFVPDEEKPLEKGYIGYLENSDEDDDYSKIFVIGDEDFALGTPFEIFEKCDEYLTTADEAPVWGYSEGEWDAFPEPLFNTLYPYLIVHAPGGITAYKDATLGTNDITVYYAADPADSESYEDVTDYVNFFYDFSEVGTTTVAAVYGNKTIEFEVEVLEPVVTKADIVNAGKTEYKIGDVFSIEDFVGQLVYSNTFTENVSAANAEFVVTIPSLEGNTPIVPGEYVMDYETDSAEVVVKYGDVEFIYNISVAEADPKGKIQFKANSVKVTSGQSFVIDVLMIDNPGISVLRAALEFDESVFTLKSVENKSNFTKYVDPTNSEDEGDVLYSSPYRMLWSSPDVNNTYIGNLVSFTFEIKNTQDLSDQIIKFNFVEAFDITGKSVGGASSKFTVDVCDVKVGDVDGTDNVNIWDAVLLKKNYMDVPQEGLLMAASDVNYDQTYSSLDSTYLNRYVVGLYGYYAEDGIPGKYKVNFKGNGFDDFTQYVTVGQKLPIPVADENSFHGWYDNPEFEGEPITDVSLWTGGEFTLWAKVGYPVSYGLLYGTYSEDYVNYDELPKWYYCDEENPFKLDFTLEAEGLTFNGWEVRVVHGIATSSPIEVPEEGLKDMPGELQLTPKYSGNTYDIYAHVYQEGIVDITEKIGTYEYTTPGYLNYIYKSLVKDLAPSIEGYPKGEVYMDADFKELCESDIIQTPYFGEGKAGDFHLYYKYVPMSYDVTFDWNYEGAPAIEGFTYEYGVKGFSLPADVPSRPGYTFTGWNIEYRDMYNSRNYPVTAGKYDKYWLLDNVTVMGTDVKFVAQWTTDSLAATISAINTLTGVTTRYTFDYTEDFTMPEGSTELILDGDVYYKFDGWYNNSQCEGDPVTVIPANGFDVNNSRYYSKWVETTSSTVIVHNRDTQEVIGEIEVTPGQEYTLPDATEYLKEVLGNEYISNDRFYIKSGTDYTEVTSFNVDFTEKHVYVDVIDVTNMVANIFTVSNYTPLARQLGVKVDGVTHLFDQVSEEKVYTIYTAPDKISTIEVLEQAQNSVNDKADVKYRAEFGGKVVEKERQIRYSDKNAGYDRVIYSPIIKDEYTLDLYVPQYKTSKLLTSTSVYNFAIHQRVAGLNLLEGYPQQIARGEKITLPVLDDLSITEFGDSTWIDYMNNCGLADEQKATLKLKFVGWFERPYYTRKNEKPITEIDTTMIGQDIQLYAIYEPEAVLFTYDNGKSYDILSGDDLTMIKMVYALTKNPKEQLYDTSEIENGRLVKAMPSEYSAYSYLVKGITETVSVDHPYATNSAYTCLYNGTVVNQTYYEYNSSANTTGYEIFYVKDAYSPQNYGPDLSLEE